MCLALLMAVLAIATESIAQTSKNQQVKRISRPMLAIDAATLQAEGMRIKLWGIKPAKTLEAPIEISALDKMDSLINSEHVNCRIMKWDITNPVARCTVKSNEDLGIAMLQAGYAVVDREQIYGSVFATSYREAQEQAKNGLKGVWKLVADLNKTSYMPEWIEKYLKILVPLSLIFVPIIGFLLMSYFTHRGLNKIAKVNAEEIEFNRNKEEALEAREKIVLASSLQGELEENKSKIEAFLTIYREILITMKDVTKTPKYQENGELIHEHPALSRGVFELSIKKLSLLDMKIVSDISKLYSGIHADPNYITLDPTTPIDDATRQVEDVIQGAESLLPHIDYVVGQLNSLISGLSVGSKTIEEEKQEIKTLMEAEDYLDMDSI